MNQNLQQECPSPQLQPITSSYYGNNTHPAAGMYPSQVSQIGHPEFRDLHPMEPVNSLAFNPGAPTWHPQYGHPYWSQYQIPYPHYQFPNQNFPIYPQTSFKQEIPTNQTSNLTLTGNFGGTNEQVPNTEYCTPEPKILKNSEDESCAELAKEDNVRPVKMFFGFVTSLDGDLGCIDKDVFFHASVLKGPMKPKTGDFVVVKAESVQNMPTFKWNAKEVQVLDKSFSTLDTRLQSSPQLQSPALCQNVSKSSSSECADSDTGLPSEMSKTSEFSSNGHKRKSCDLPDMSDDIQILKKSDSPEIIDCVTSENKIQDPKNLAVSDNNQQNICQSTYSDPNQLNNVPIQLFGVSKIKTEKMDAFQENVLNEVTAKSESLAIPTVIVITKIKTEKCDQKSDKETGVKLVGNFTEPIEKDKSNDNLNFGTKMICENVIEDPQEKDVQLSTPNSSLCIKIPLSSISIKKEKIDKSRESTKSRDEDFVECITSEESSNDSILVTKTKTEKCDPIPDEEMAIEPVENSVSQEPFINSFNSSVDLTNIDDQTQCASPIVKFALTNRKNDALPPCNLRFSQVNKSGERNSEKQNDPSSDVNAAEQSDQISCMNSSRTEYKPKSAKQEQDKINISNPTHSNEAQLDLEGRLRNIVSNKGTPDGNSNSNACYNNEAKHSKSQLQEIDSTDESDAEKSNRYSYERYERRRKPRSSSSSSTGFRVEKFRGPTCSTCGKVGHRGSVCFQRKREPNKVCFYCGRSTHPENECWTRLACKRCGKKGHPAWKCRARP